MTKGYPIFEWISGIPITDKDYKTQNEDNDVSSTNEDEENDDITENGEEAKSIKEAPYKDDYPPDRENYLSDNIIKNQDQTEQEDATIKNDSKENIIKYEDMEQTEEV